MLIFELHTIISLCASLLTPPPLTNEKNGSAQQNQFRSSYNNHISLDQIKFAYIRIMLCSTPRIRTVNHPLRYVYILISKKRKWIDYVVSLIRFVEDFISI